jgi:hypothetical protein
VPSTRIRRESDVDRETICCLRTRFKLALLYPCRGLLQLVKPFLARLDADAGGVFYGRLTLIIDAHHQPELLENSKRASDGRSSLCCGCGLATSSVHDVPLFVNSTPSIVTTLFRSSYWLICSPNSSSSSAS